MLRLLIPDTRYRGRQPKTVDRASQVSANGRLQTAVRGRLAIVLNAC